MSARGVPAVGLLLFAGLVLAGAGAAVLATQYRVYHVLSDSMVGTVLAGDRIVAHTPSAGGAGLRRGDLVMLDRAAWPDAEAADGDYVKRVVALGGDELSYVPERASLRVNGHLVREDYVDDPRFGGPAVTVRVPAGHVFVLGDNRAGSQDSRAHLDSPTRGAVPVGAVTGRVVAVAAPLERMRVLEPTAAFTPAGETPEADGTLLPAVAAVGAGMLLWLAAGLVEVRAHRRAESAG